MYPYPQVQDNPYLCCIWFMMKCIPIPKYRIIPVLYLVYDEMYPYPLVRDIPYLCSILFMMKCIPIPKDRIYPTCVVSGL